MLPVLANQPIAHLHGPAPLLFASRQLPNASTQEQIPLMSQENAPTQMQLAVTEHLNSAASRKIHDYNFITFKFGGNFDRLGNRMG